MNTDPDHSVITLETDTLSVLRPNHLSEHEINNQNSETNSQNQANFVAWNPRKYCFDYKNVHFMSDDNWQVNINQFVNEFESNLNIKGNINHLYDRLCNIVFTEMDINLDYTDSRNTFRKRLNLSTVPLQFYYDVRQNEKTQMG